MRYKVTILSSVLCFGLVVFVTKKFFLRAEEKEKKRCRKQQKSVSVFQGNKEGGFCYATYMPTCTLRGFFLRPK